MVLNNIFNIFNSNSDNSIKKTYQYFTNMSLDKFNKKWYAIHDKVGDLKTSGMEFRRVVSLFITYDPLSIPVNKMI